MATEFVHKVTLSSGKAVVLRDMKIRHQELAAQAVGSRHTDAPIAQNVAMQNELLKVLLVSVTGEDGSTQEFKSHYNLDDWFTMQEYKQTLKALEQITGAGEATGAPKIEVSSSGGK